MSGTRAPAEDQRTISVRIFASLAAYAFVLAIVYGIYSDELAGLALLVIAGLASAGFAGWLHLQSSDDREAEPSAPSGDRAAEDPAPFLPSTSRAPLLLGAGATFVIAGIPLGLWVAVPGGLVLVWGIHDLIRQNVDHR